MTEGQRFTLAQTTQETIDEIIDRHMYRLRGMFGSEAGYRGLYGGLTRDALRARRQLPEGEDLVNWMSPDELSANLFRISLAEAKIGREQIHDPEEIERVHFQAGQCVRQAIAQAGSMVPEDLPVPSQSMRQHLRDELLWLQRSDVSNSFEISSKEED